MLDTVVPSLLRRPSAEHFRPRINATTPSEELDALDKLADKRIEENEHSASMEGYATSEERQEAWHTNKHLIKLEKQLRDLMRDLRLHTGPKQDLIDFSAKK